MEIRFTSTLTSEDEDRIAGALLAALVALIENLPISYALRIETAGRKVFQHSNMSEATFGAAPATDPTAQFFAGDEPIN